MSRESPYATVLQVLHEVAPRAKLRNDKPLADHTLRDDLDLDSVALVEIAIALEVTSRAPVTDDDIEACITVGDLVRLMESKGRAAA